MSTGCSDREVLVRKFFAATRGFMMTAVLLFGGSIATAAEYSITGFEYPTSEPTLRYRTVPYDINDYGQAVGKAVHPGSLRGFLYSDGRVIDIGAFDARKINNNGRIAGVSQTDALTHVLQYRDGALTDLGAIQGFAGFGLNDANQLTGVSGDPVYGHATVYDNGSMTDLGVLPGHGASVGIAINNRGQVTGNSYPVYTDGFHLVYGQPQGFIYSNGVMTNLGTLGSSRSIAANLNNSGQVVGNSETKDIAGQEGNFVSRAFLYGEGRMNNLGNIYEGKSSANDINDFGQVVGNIMVLSRTDAMYTESVPFLYSDGRMIDLNRLLPENSGWTLYDAVAINNAGQILGVGDRGAYIMTPVAFVPLPPAGLLLLSGLLAIFSMTCKSRHISKS